MADTKATETKTDDIKTNGNDTPKKNGKIIDLDAPWTCPTCKMSNSGSTWKCYACYRPRLFKGKGISFKIPSKMKGLLKETEVSGYEYIDMEIPDPKEDELLVRSCAVGICGSDNILYKWTKDAQVIAKTPFIPGHECVGIVVKGGTKTKMSLGTRIAVENHFYCGECYLCKIGRTDICGNLSQFGHGKGTKYGGMAQYFIVKEKYCYRLRTNISWRDAALLEPLGVAYNACVQCDSNLYVKYNDTMNSVNEYCLIIGCGTIGLLSIGVLKAKKYTNIIAIDIVEDKLNVAKKMGAKYVINGMKTPDIKAEIFKITNNVGASKIIECSGNAKMVSGTFEFVRKGGNIVFVGLPKTDLVVKNPMKEIVFKSIQLRTIHGRRIFGTWKATEQLVAKGKINLDLVMSKKYNMVPLTQFEQVFKDFAKGKEMKIVFDPQK